MTFYATLPEVKTLKRTIGRLEQEVETLNKRLDMYESIYGPLSV